MPMTTTVRAEAVTTDEQRELFRRIRNADAAMLSHDARPITRAQNMRFWREEGHNVRAWFYFYGDSWSQAGVGSLRIHDGYQWTFVAVLPAFRGHGIGTSILRDLTARALESGPEVNALVREDHAASLGMHKPADGWEIISTEQGVHRLRWNPSRGRM